MGELSRRMALGWEETVEAFLTDKRFDADTATRYRSILGALQRHALASSDPNVPDRDAIWDYVHTLTDRKLSPSTTAAHLRRIRTFLEWLEPSAVPATVAPVDWAFVDVLVRSFEKLARDRWNARRRGGEGTNDPVLTLPMSVTAVVIAQLLVDQGGRLRERLQNLERRGSFSDAWSRWARRLPERAESAGFDVRELGLREDEPFVVAGGGAGRGGGTTTSSNGDDPHEPKSFSGRRYLEGSAKAAAAPGEVVVADVRIALVAGSLPHSALDFGAIPIAGIEVVIAITAPGFEILTPASFSVHVPPDTDSAWHHVELKATTPGRQSIAFSVFRDGTYVGALALEVGVDAGISVASAPTATATGPLSARPIDPDELSLIVSWRPATQGGRFIYKLQGQGTPDVEFESEVLLESVEVPLAGLVELLDAFARNEATYSDIERDNKILAYGAELWATFLPDVLRQTLLGMPPQVRRLTIIGKNDPLPWELFLPTEPGSAQPRFLTERFEITRWSLGGPAAAGNVKCAMTAFVLPPDSPPTARREIASIRKLGSNLKKGSTVRTLDEMTATLSAGAFDLLHFASHNYYGVRDEGVPFGGRKRFAPRDLAYFQGTKTLAARSPLVFMNACRTAGKDTSYTSLVGWADRFLEAGAGAFVGSLWAVRDESAAMFSQAFYGALIGGSTIGQAATAARAATRASGDPSWLAYTVYADPAGVFEGSP
jgi:CHAT domain